MITPVNNTLRTNMNYQLKNSNQIAFTGIYGSRMVSKAINQTVSDKTSYNLIDIFKQIKTKLPFVKKELPVTDNPARGEMMTNEKMQKLLEEEAQKRLVVKARKRECEQKLKDAGCNIDNGDIDQHGYLTIQGNEKIRKAQEAKVVKEAKGDKDKTSFKGEENNENLNNNIEHTKENDLAHDNMMDDKDALTSYDAADDINDFGTVKNSITPEKAVSDNTFADFGFDSGNGLGITPSIETKVPENLDVDLLDHIDTDLVPVKLSDIGVEDAIEQMLDMIN